MLLKSQISEAIVKSGRLAALGPWVFVLLCVALLPLIFGATEFADYLLYLTVRMMILSIYAMSYDLLFGYTGILSFAHSMFIGGGAYTLGIMTTRFSVGLHDSTGVILMALVIGIALGWILGFLSSRVGWALAVFLVTFALAEMVQLLVLSDPLKITGAEDGIAGIPRQVILGFVNIESELHFYYFTAIVLCLSYLALRAIIRMPFGDVLVGIRENPLRVRFLGYNVRHYRIAAFMISGFFASLSGSLTALHEGSVGPSMFGWVLSADAIIYMVLGGPGTLLGPVVGASIMLMLQEILSDIFHNWLIFMGIGYICLIMFMPKGMLPIIQRIRKAYAKGVPEEA